LTFGLGASDRADEAAIEWPAGARQSIGPLHAGHAYVVTEGKGITGDRPLRR
jgi:hypothetical protein